MSSLKKLFFIFVFVVFVYGISMSGNKKAGNYEVTSDVINATRSGLFSDVNIDMDFIVGSIGNTIWSFGDDEEMVAGFIPTFGDAPYIKINNVSARTDGSGYVDINISCSDPDKDYLRLKIFASSDSVNFTQITLLEDEAYVSSSILPKPDIDNSSSYQVGNNTTTPIIGTSINTITFVWDSRADFPIQDYQLMELKFVLNDWFLSNAGNGFVFIDNFIPQIAAMSPSGSRTDRKIEYNLPSPTLDKNFNSNVGYEIFYSTDPLVPINPDKQYKDDILYKQDFDSETSIYIGGLFPDTTYYARIWCYDNYSNVTSSITLDGIITTALPVVLIDEVFNSMDGSGIIFTSVTLTDANGDDCSLRFEYSTDGGTSWDNAHITTITSDFNARNNLPPLIDNTTTYYQLRNLGTSSANENRLLIGWDTKIDSIIESSSTKIRIHPDSERPDEHWTDFVNLFQRKENKKEFSIDNFSPLVPQNFNPGDFRTADRVSFDWKASSDGLYPHFYKYEIWYSTQPNVNRFKDGCNVWSDSQTQDVFMGVESTTNTIITNLLEGTTYYFRLYALDSFGNVSDSDVLGDLPHRPLFRPNAYFVYNPTQPLNGKGFIEVRSNVYDHDFDPEVELRIEYSTVSLSGPFETASLDSLVNVSQLESPLVNNSDEHQLGEPGGYIDVSEGTNTVTFNWDARFDLGKVELIDVYLRIKGYDGINEALTFITSNKFDLDVKPPVYIGSEYSHDTKVLRIKYDEDLLNDTFVTQGIYLSNNKSGATDRILVSENILFEDSETLVSTLTDEVRDEIASWQRGGYKLYVDISTDVVRDITANSNEELFKTEITTWTKDNTPPQLLSADYNYNTRELILKFNEGMSIESLTNISLEGVRLQTVENNDDNSLPYLNLRETETIVTTEDSFEITIKLSDESHVDVVSWGSDSLFIGLNEDVIKNISGINVTPILKFGALEINYISDDEAPNILKVNPAEFSIDSNPVDLSIKIKFNERMYRPTTINSFSLRAIRNNQGVTVNENVPGTFSYDDAKFELTFTPIDSFKYNYRYKAIMKNTGQDISRNNLSKTKEWIFSTLLNHDEDNIVLAEGDVSTKIHVPQKYMTENGYVDIESEISSDDVIIANNKKIAESEYSKPLDLTGREFNIYNINRVNMFEDKKLSLSEVKADYSKDVEISIKYDDTDNDGIIDSSYPPIREKTLAMYILNTRHKLWMRIPRSVVDTENNIVTSFNENLGIFVLIGTPDYDLSNAYAYPVPFKPSDGHTHITFTNLASICDIKIYNIAGELVKTIKHTNGELMLNWDVTSEKGNMLASGVYIYIIKSKEDKKEGKIIVIK